MAFQHGKDSALKLDNVAGSLTDISQYVRSSEGLPGSAEPAETTTYGKEAKTYIQGLSDAVVSLEGVWDSALDAVFGAPANWATTRSFEFGPAGSGSGAVKYSGEALISSYAVSAPVGGVVTWSATLQVSDAITRGTFA